MRIQKMACPFRAQYQTLRVVVAHFHELLKYTARAHLRNFHISGKFLFIYAYTFHKP